VSVDELRREQAYLDRLYARLDQLRARAAAELDTVRRAGAHGTPQARSERDAFAAWHAGRLAQLEHAEPGLCFGRVDLRTGERRYIGRIGLSDDDQHQLLVDWRAPAAEDFYRATAAQPGPLVRRRHLLTRDRHVTGIEDEVLDLAHLDAAQLTTLSGEGLMLATLNAARTGRMGDIVATIQAEQDRVIRAPLEGVLVVQGGPGTGKTAVALHRTAYLLYTHRERLARRGVLVVGPSPVFLRYIEQVLPSLGETGVVMATAGELFPGVVARAEEPPALARLKGDARMAAVIAAAVRNRVRIPTEVRQLRVDGVPLRLTPLRMEQARERARRAGRPHNAARVTFVLDLLDELADQLADGLGPRLAGRDRAELIDDLRASRDVRRELNLAFPPLSAEGLLADLYARPDRLAAACAGRLSAAEQAMLARDREAPWTVADVPLLDEVASLIGEDDTAARAAARAVAAARAEQVEYARAVLEQVGGRAAAMVTAAELADRFASGPGDGGEAVTGDALERDREFGHVVVDEAQELSPMMWRLLARRCPSGSMTVVGDLAQASDPAGVRRWDEALEPVFAGRWRVVELTVNYRTPAQIMDLAARVLVASGGAPPGYAPPSSVRSGEDPPELTRASAEDLDALAAVVADEVDGLAGGRLAVVGPRHGLRQRVDHLATVLGEGVVGEGPAGLDRPVGVFTADGVKGLEFDVVVLVDPGRMLAERVTGPRDVYVAMTRATQRLHVVADGQLPRGMEHLTEVPVPAV
jgi:DNA helicase IV